MNGIDRIAQERGRQIVHWGAEHDDHHDAGELIMAAIAYATVPLRGGCMVNGDSCGWPWDEDSFSPSDDPIRNLEKAGALIAAEIDRLLRRPVSWALEGQPDA